MTLKVGMQHWVLEYFQICSNDDPELTLTYFTARSTLIPYSFVWEKGKICLYTIYGEKLQKSFSSEPRGR